MSMHLYYYNDQVGGGSGIRNVYVGAPRQRGRGVGAWLGGLFRTIVPYVRGGAKALAKEAAKTGVHILGDVSRGDISFNDSVRMRSRESGRKLAKKASEKLSEIMRGRGYKMKRKSKRSQSKKNRPAARKTRNKSIKRSSGKRLKNRKKQVIKKKRNNKKKNTRDVTDIFA
uniref:N-acetyltransferase domain-containing protein n=1 Tax=Trichogramma kaykai TaxID=54128 RepID=A0ABD2VTJ8_9HYME